MTDSDPLIFLDLDAMVTNLQLKIVGLHNAQHGTQLGVDAFQFDAEGEFFLAMPDGALISAASYLNEDRVFIDLEPLPGALEAIDELRRLGDLLIVTAPSRNDDSASDKLRWIRAHLPVSRKKVALIKEKWHLRGDVFLDDWPENLRNFRRHNPTAFVGTISYPYNNLGSDILNLRADDYTTTRQAWGTLVAGVQTYLRTR